MLCFIWVCGNVYKTQFNFKCENSSVDSCFEHALAHIWFSMCWLRLCSFLSPWKIIRERPRFDRLMWGEWTGCKSALCSASSHIRQPSIVAELSILWVVWGTIRIGNVSVIVVDESTKSANGPQGCNTSYLLMSSLSIFLLVFIRATAPHLQWWATD